MKNRILTVTILLSLFLPQLHPLFITAQVLKPGTPRQETIITTKDNTLLQFTSQGHVLGFQNNSIIIASATHMMKVNFLNANQTTPTTSEEIEESINKNQSQPLNKVTYRNLYNNIDLVYEAKEGTIVKSTYYVDITKPNTDYKEIRLQYNRPLSIDNQGNLQIKYDIGILTEHAPIAWQETEQGRHPVNVNYKLYNEYEVGFEIDNYLPNIPIVIDPDLTWNTFLGGSGDDYVLAIAIDTSGNIYVVGYSGAAWGTPIRAYTSGDDAFVVKLNSSGELVWNTFLGGSGSDYVLAIAIDTSGNIYVGGRSGATWGTPVRAYTSGSDAFAAKLNSSGELVWNTFLGGSGSDYVLAIAIDTSGNIYVGGCSTATWGTPIRAYTSGDDAFAVKLNSSGELVWNTFLGGSGYDSGNTIAIDTSGNIYIGGYSTATWGTPIRAYTSGNDAFAAKLNSSGELVWNTFLGGSGIDYGNGIAIDTLGNIYVGGESGATWGTPVRAYTSGNDAFVVKLSQDTTPPVCSSFSPASGSTINDATQTITFTTDENATCYLSFNDESYYDMSDDTLCSGGGTMSHSCTTPDIGFDGAKTIYIACTNIDAADTADTNEELSYILDTTPPQTPIANSVGTTYNSTQNITLSSQGSNAIYYTTNGDVPTTSSTLYTQPITISENTTLKAIATDEATNQSGLMTEVYTINLTISSGTSIQPQTQPPTPTTTEDNNNENDNQESQQENQEPQPQTQEPPTPTQLTPQQTQSLIIQIKTKLAELIAQLIVLLQERIKTN